ncbi:MAG: alpha/beta hydrolase-fold protein, partial [Proteobacteria bacterium]|nr:alpha/beta hydrolase-fold protein [Pseudomonadota bacterium]
MPIAPVTQNKCFDGTQGVYSHTSPETGCTMRFGVFMPPQANSGSALVPILYWLSGLTCTEENFIVKAGA